MDATQWLQLLALAALCGVILRLNLWRALLWLSPGSLRIHAEDGPSGVKLPHPLVPVAAALEELGFVALGSRQEKPLLEKPTLSFDYVLEGEATFATLFQGSLGRPRLYFLTPLQGGGFVLTANHRRPAREVKGHYVSGGLEGLSPERLLKAHRRRVQGFEVAKGADLSLQGRVEAARAWFAGPGRSEVRQQNVLGLLWSVGTVGMVVAASAALFWG
jgi:hypothetical protein